MFARLFAWSQFLMPKYWITALIYRITRVRNVAFKDFLIRRFVRLYDVDTAEVRLQVPDDFGTFNEFFIRELEAASRPVDSATEVVVSPADGTVSQAGRLREHSILQAKGIEYTLEDLLAIDIDNATAFADGCFATIYLAPYNYHRVHAPIAGELVSANYVPGDLFSVNAATVRHIPGVFRRNERLVLHFRTAVGPVAVIMVGAMNVGSISTPWTGEIRPRYKGVVESFSPGNEAVAVSRGELLGWFNMGSTVIVLLPDAVGEWHESLVAGSTVRMGQAIGKLAVP